MSEKHIPDLNYQLSLLQQLIKSGPVYLSPSGQDDCADKIATSLSDLGWEVDTPVYRSDDLADNPLRVPVESFGDDYKNDGSREKKIVIGTIDSGKPGRALILNGHYDVEPVATPEAWREDWNSGVIRDGRVWGRGASDMLAGLTSQISVASSFISNKRHWAGKIILTAVPDEEIGGNGTVAAINELSKRSVFTADPSDILCLIAEPSDKTIGLKSYGFMHAVLESAGISRHMAGGIQSDNALYDTIKVITDFENILERVRYKIDRNAPRLLHTFGIIHGGTDAATPMSNVVSEATVLYPPETPASLLQSLISQDVHETASRSIMRFSDFLFDGQATPANILADSLIATNKAKTAEVGVFPSPCDARIFTQSGIEKVVIYGPGSLSQAHIVDEYVDVESIRHYNRHLKVALWTCMKA